MMDLGLGTAGYAAKCSIESPEFYGGPSVATYLAVEMRVVG